MSMIVGKEIDHAAPIFIEADLVEAESTYYGPLTFEFCVDGEDLLFAYGNELTDVRVVECFRWCCQDALARDALKDWNTRATYILC
jgi:hypothetical protein